MRGDKGKVVVKSANFSNRMRRYWAPHQNQSSFVCPLYIVRPPRLSLCSQGENTCLKETDNKTDNKSVLLRLLFSPATDLGTQVNR